MSEAHGGGTDQPLARNVNRVNRRTAPLAWHYKSHGEYRMTKAGRGASGETRRLVWGGAFVIVLFGGYLAATHLPPAQSEEQALTTTVVAGDYDHPYGLASGTLQSSRGEGLGAEMQTVVTYKVSGTPGNGIMNGPDLRARVIHVSGAVMVCGDMWRTPRLEAEGRAVTLGCDRTVDFGELREWSVVELTACFNIQQFDELRAEQPCGDSFFN